MQNILSTPLHLPRVEPINWDNWWTLWYKESRPVKKIQTNHNTYTAPWRGFDIWVKPGIDTEETTKYKSKNLNCPELFPSIFDNIDQFPIDIEVVRFVSSIGEVFPHTDYDSESLSVRSLVYDNNVRPNFYYLKDTKREYQLLPPDTNTWAYWDHKRKHGTNWYFGHSKILITYFGKPREGVYQDMLTKNAQQYQEYVIFAD